MEVKMFISSGNISDLEKEINAWMASHKIKVETIKQSYTCEAKSCYALVSIWFEELGDLNEI